MAKQTKDEQINSLKKIGIEINKDFEISPQAMAIIERIDDFPVEHFKSWWKENFGIIHAGHLHQYLSGSEGIERARK